ncbi:hypothetical protein D3C80_908350 [compost metagenome]
MLSNQQHFEFDLGFAVLAAVIVRSAVRIALARFQFAIQSVVVVLWFVIFVVLTELKSRYFAAIKTVFVPASFSIQTVFSLPVAIHFAKAWTVESDVEIIHWLPLSHVLKYSVQSEPT